MSAKVTADIHSLLADERLRNEQHKSNYQKLKTEHNKLQAEHMKLEEELKEHLAKSEQTYQQLKDVIDRLQSENTEWKQRCQSLDELHGPEAQQKLLSEMDTSIVRPLQTRLVELERVNDSLRRENSSMQRDLMFLQTEHDSSLAKQQRIIDELRLKYNAEVEGLRRERMALLARQDELTPDRDFMARLQSENIEMSRKVHDLHNDLKLLQQATDKQKAADDAARRSLENDVQELKALLQVLSSERESLKAQLERQMLEYKSMNRQLQDISTEKTHLEQECILLRNKNEECEHRMVVEKQKLQLEHTTKSADFEKQINTLQTVINEKSQEVDRLTERCAALRLRLDDHENELARKVQVALSHQLHSIQRLESDRCELERRLRAFEMGEARGREEAGVSQANLSERLRTAEQDRDDWQQKFSNCRSSAAEMEGELKLRRAEAEEFQRKLAQASKALEDGRSNERELGALNTRLQQEIHSLSERVDRIKSAPKQDSGQMFSHMSAEERLSFEQQRRQMERRIVELETENRTFHSSVDKDRSDFAQLKLQYDLKCKQLKQLKQKFKQLTLETDALRQRVPADKFDEVNKKLHRLCEKHSEFCHLLSLGVQSSDISGREFAFVGNTPAS